MAITVESSEVEYTGTGYTEDFAVPFLFYADGDLVVTKALDGDVAILQTLGVRYTVAGEGSEGAGTVHFLEAPEADSTITISRTVPFTQETALVSQGTFDPATHEMALDYVTFLAQQLDRRTSILESIADGFGEVTVGAGLTNDANTINVGQGTGLVVNADDVALDVTRVVTATDAGLQSAADKVKQELRWTEHVNVMDAGIGATGDGETDDTVAFELALAAGDYVYCPPGEYVVSGFTIPSGKTLELGLGARLFTSGTIYIEGVGTQFVGHIFQPKYESPYTGDIWGSNVLWTGGDATGEYIIQVNSEVGVTCTGLHLKGILVDGGGDDVNGWGFGTTTAGGVIWSSFYNIGAVRTTVGMDLVGNVQTCNFYDTTIVNENDAITPIAGKTLVRMGSFQGPVITTINFFGGHWSGGQVTIKIGNESLASAQQGAYGVNFWGLVCDTPLDLDGGALCFVDIVCGTRINIVGCQLNGGEGDDTFTSRAVKLGRNDHTYYKAVDCSIRECDIGAPIAFEGYGWENCCIRDNTLFITNGQAGNGAAFRNSGIGEGGGGPIRRYMEWTGNRMIGGNQLAPEIDDYTGFNKGSMYGSDVDMLGNRTVPIDLSVSAYHQTINNGDVAHVIPSTMGTYSGGWLEVVDGTGHNYAKFWIPYEAGNPVLMEDTGSIFSATFNNASTVNFYWDGDNFKMQNNTVAPKLFFFNMKIFPNGG